MSWIGSIFQGAGMIREGRDARDQAKLDAAQKEAGARKEIEAASLDETAFRRSARQFLGRQQAAQAESGLAGTTPEAVARQSAIDAELDALNIKYQGKLKAWALREGLQSELSAGKAKERAGYLSGAGAFLQGIGDYRRQNA